MELLLRRIVILAVYPLFFLFQLIGEGLLAITGVLINVNDWYADHLESALNNE